MKTEDPLGNPITATPSVAHGVCDFVDGFLSYETKAANVLAAAESDPSCCIANIYAAMMFMFLESPQAPGRAAPFLECAAAAQHGATARERLNLAFVKAWARDEIATAHAIGEEIAASHPRDLVILKLRQYLSFNVGDAPAMLRAAKAQAPANQHTAAMHAMLAFAFEQCHLLQDAERSAWKALDIKAKEPWAHHALAHVMLTQGRIDEGARFLTSVAPTWTDLNSFMLTHNWWHLGLFYISQGRSTEALGLYDANVWGEDKSYSQDQAGAVSMLSRLELAGVDVGERWQDVAANLLGRAQDATLPFLSLHYLYGLARAYRPQADSLLSTFHRRARTGPTAWEKVALPAAIALHAHAQRRYAVSASHLAKALPHIAMIGGSHAQRDWFEQIWLDALIKNKDFTAAQHLLEMRRKHDPDGVPLNLALGDVYGALSLHPQADQARARAHETKARHAGGRA